MKLKEISKHNVVNVGFDINKLEKQEIGKYFEKTFNKDALESKYIMIDGNVYEVILTDIGRKLEKLYKLYV